VVAVAGHQKVLRDKLCVDAQRAKGAPEYLDMGVKTFIIIIIREKKISLPPRV
jgi:hypothetical protein